MKVRYLYLDLIKETQVQEGRTLLDLALLVGVPAPYDCMEGSCGSCEALVNGKLVRTCQTLPSSEDDTVCDYNKGQS